MTVALFLYQQIFCRYLTPGCIVYDRGELVNKIVETLKSEFKCEARIISAGRLQSNGQAERYVQTLKQRMITLMSDDYDELPENWDECLLHHALQCVRSDPSSATGFAPAELLIGRKLVYPLELTKKDIDFDGKKLYQEKFT